MTEIVATIVVTSDHLNRDQVQRLCSYDFWKDSHTDRTIRTRLKKFTFSRELSKKIYQFGPWRDPVSPFFTKDAPKFDSQCPLGSAPIWSVFSGLWSGSGLFSRNWSGNGPDLHKKVRIWPKMEELTLKIGLFHHEFNDEVDVLQSWKCREFSENTGKSLILRYWSGFKAYFGPDLVRIGTKKWSGIGPILINLGPIWQVVALRRHFCPSPYRIVIS